MEYIKYKIGPNRGCSGLESGIAAYRDANRPRIIRNLLNYYFNSWMESIIS
jgi:hypothetical protein